MKIVLYGAGKRGRAIYSFLKTQGLSEHVYGFCDKRGKEIRKIEDKPVYLLEDLRGGKDIVYCVTVIDREVKEEIKSTIKGEKCIEFSDLADIFNYDKVKFNRDFCAFYHIENMDSYFQKAETDNLAKVFWNSDSEFYRLFQKLDITKVIELGCGRGRHVPYIISKSRDITLVDILQKNIDYCKERFGENQGITYYKNTGFELKALKSDNYTALYSYDAMVHFELMDIYSYLTDIFRILSAGGRALLHHSNYHADYKVGFSTAPQGRSFMSKECFAYLAYRAGFTILEQIIIDWGSDERLDCISLIEKPVYNL